MILSQVSLSARRAWIEIVTRYRPTPKPVMSLSARRAWIEIFTGSYHPHFHVVALRKESVDRNLSLHNSIRRCLMSLSARRAWIEIKTSALVP